VIDRVHCAGCRNDFYNSSDLAVGGCCWSRKTAVLKLRRKVHINDLPPHKRKPGQFPSCYSAPQYVMIDVVKGERP
jgi:hypothetical protein